MTPKQQQRLSRVVWFEIPVADFNRACGFYEAILDVTLNRGRFGPDPIAIFPYQEPGIGGCITQSQSFVPGSGGPVVYVNADPSLDAVLTRVESAGGKVLVPRTALPEDKGFYARILDTEGNAVGLHAIS